MSKREFLNALKDFEFPLTERKNVMKESQKSYRGFVLGTIINRPATIQKYNKPVRDLSKLTKSKKYQPIYELAKKVMKKHNPNFKFSTIQFNKNHQSIKHRDQKNATDSYIIGFGDYNCGDLRVWSEDGKTYKDYNIKNKWFRFNGAKHFHETLPFKGERYTMVYYNV